MNGNGTNTTAKDTETIEIFYGTLEDSNPTRPFAYDLQYGSRLEQRQPHPARAKQSKRETSCVDEYDSMAASQQRNVTIHVT
jgi:hypothetical protein